MTEASQIPFHFRRVKQIARRWRGHLGKGVRNHVVESLIVLCTQQCAGEVSGARRWPLAGLLKSHDSVSLSIAARTETEGFSLVLACSAACPN